MTSAEFEQAAAALLTGCNEFPTVWGRWMPEAYDHISERRVLFDGDPPVKVQEDSHPIHGVQVQSNITSGDEMAFGDQNVNGTGDALIGVTLFIGNRPAFVPIDDPYKVWVHQPGGGLPT